MFRNLLSILVCVSVACACATKAKAQGIRVSDMIRTNLVGWSNYVMFHGYPVYPMLQDTIGVRTVTLSNLLTSLTNLDHWKNSSVSPNALLETSNKLHAFKVDSTNGYSTNAILDKPNILSGVNFGSAFSSPAGSWMAAENFGAGAHADNDYAVALGASASAGGEVSSSVGFNSSSSGTFSSAFGGSSEASGDYSAAVGALSAGRGKWSVAIGFGADSSYSNSIAIGSLVTNQRPGEIRLGRGQDVIVGGALESLGDISALGGLVLGGQRRTNWPAVLPSVNVQMHTNLSGEVLLASTDDISFQNRFRRLKLGNGPLRIGAMGDSLGDDIPLTILSVVAPVIGTNGGYLTSLQDGSGQPFTFNSSGASSQEKTTNWFGLHWLLSSGQSVTFSSAGNWVKSDTFRVAMVHVTNGGVFKVEVATNGGSFSTLLPDTSTSSYYPTGVVYSWTTNAGEWKLRVVGVSGTNVLVGAGMWMSSSPGFRISHLWATSLSPYDVVKVPSSVTVPILSSLQLDGLYWKSYDSASVITNYLPGMIDVLKSGAPDADVVFLEMHPVTGDSEVELGNMFMRQRAVEAGFDSVPMHRIFPSTNALVSLGWVTDGSCAHLLQSANDYLASQLLRREPYILNSLYNAGAVPSGWSSVFGQLARPNRWSATNVFAGWVQFPGGVSGPMNFNPVANETQVTMRSFPGQTSFILRIVDNFAQTLFGVQGNNIVRHTAYRADNFGPTYIFEKWGTSGSSNAPVVSGGDLGTISFQGATNVGGLSAIGAYILAEASQNWSASARGTRLRFYTVPNDSNVDSESLRIEHGTTYIYNHGHVASNLTVQGIMVFPTNTVTTPPSLSLGSFAFWNSNGLALWKCWNTNGTTVCIPMP